MPRSIFRALFAFVLGCAILSAQEFRSTVSGRVTDQQSAAIPNAEVVLTEISTGATFRTSTDEAGAYTLPFVPPGAYKITASAPGFKSYLQTGIAVQANERPAIDIQLQIGQASETLTVSADAPMLSTETASTGQVINSREIDNIPLNGRTPLVVAQLAFGVIPNSDPRFNRPFDNAGPSGFSIGGAPAQSNELLLNGSPDVTQNSRVAYNPPIDATQEVKVESFAADAAYGHTGGGTVNVILKGGTNQIHGTLYEFNQTSALESTNFFLNRAGKKLPVGRYNQYGVTAGGPIFIPKVYDGRNRVFWFFAYEGIKDSYPETINTTVPTQAERGGDFSALLSVSKNYRIYNPFTGVVQGSHIARQPFAGNVIPPNLLNPIALAYLKYYPLPNQTGNADGQNNYVANSVRSDTYGSELGRLDFNFSERHKLFADIRVNDRTENRGNRFFNLASGNFLTRANAGSTADDVYTFTPTAILNTRLSWGRFVESNAKPSNGFDPTTLGFPALIKANARKLVLPQLNFGGFQQLGDNAGSVTPFDIFQIFSALTKIHGRQTLKFGVDARLYRESSIGYGNSTGSYTFGTNFTRGPLDNSTSAPLGQDFASFLLGLPTGGGYDLNAARTNQAGYFALFLQDDVRVKSNLTFNLGLRYERDLATTERYNRTVNNFDNTVANPIAPAVLTAYAAHPVPQIPAGQFSVPGGVLFATPSYPNVYNTHGRYFSPRFGFAWTPAGLGGKTVIRGGFGVFIAPIVTTGISQLGFSQQTTFVATQDSFLTPYATLSNPFPLGILQPTGSSLGLSTFDGKAITFHNPHPLNPYSERVTLGFQRQLANNVVIEVGYIGNHSVHLPVDLPLDSVSPQFLSTALTRDQAVIDRNTANVKNPFAGLLPGTSLNGSTVGLAQLLRPYPEYTAVTEQAASMGSSYFHMGQVRLEKRFSAGLQLLANYEHSRLMEKRSILNPSLQKLEKRVSPDDRPNRLVVSGNYELPFGRGKLFGSQASHFADMLIGGFVLSGVYQIQSGAPVGWGNVIYLGGPLNWDPTNVSHAFDTTRFVTDPKQQLDQNIRYFPSQFNNLRSARSNTMDAALIKNTHVTERVNVQLRVEFFNVLNHPIFNGPDTNPTSTTFGQITSQANDIGRVGQVALRIVF
ncbi:MAG TPA: TonB-dependent receptor [Solibacterales bacterium]|nr:TonB-dependent receptor [Bryobacterales bacterium]